jgi:vesicle-associated membrane protein 7
VQSFRKHKMTTQFHFFGIYHQLDHTILVETSNPGSEISKTISDVLNSAPPTTKINYQSFRQLWFAYALNSDYYFVLVCDEAVPLRVVFSFIDTIQKDFTNRFIIQSLTFKPKKYKQFLIAQMQNTLLTADKLQKVKNEVDDVRDIMLENVQKVHTRGIKLEGLLNQTTIMNENAQAFHSESKKLKCHQCIRYYFCCFASCCDCCADCY